MAEADLVRPGSPAGPFGVHFGVWVASAVDMMSVRPCMSIQMPRLTTTWTFLWGQEGLQPRHVSGRRSSSTEDGLDSGQF